MMICKQEKCTGCSACASVCPKNCISMNIDGLGNVIPQIDLTKCINCGACSRVCPVNSAVKKESYTKCYACYSITERDTSSSGGIAAAIVDEFISCGGSVCGAAYSEGYVHHIVTQDAENAKILKGSKYVQSDMGQCFNEIKERLCDQKVLFIGTPCQVAGLRNYIGKADENLYCIDLICHGVVSSKFLEEVKQGFTGKITFRKNGDFAVFGNGKRLKHSDEYIVAFMNGLDYRTSCYSCTYAEQNRVGDITLGDFWGIKNFPEADRGVSIALINTAKGGALFDRIKDKLYIEERHIEETLPSNPQLSRPSHEHKNRGKFLTLYPKHGFVKAVRRCMKKELFKEKVKHIVFGNKLLSKIYGVLK